MKKISFIIGVVMIAMLVSMAADANAQSRFHSRMSKGALGNRVPVYTTADADGMTMNGYQGRVNMARSLKMASHNSYSPAPFYTYSNRGLNACRLHHQNQTEAAQTPWHGEYMGWQWRQPTALIVPPTASYQTSYGWGVGQVKSTPIVHQFGRQSVPTSGAGAASYKKTPYWPNSTEQFGIYPVRAPW